MVRADLRSGVRVGCGDGVLGVASRSSEELSDDESDDLCDEGVDSWVFFTCSEIVEALE